MNFFFVEKGYDEYANYTEIEKQEKIIELDLIDKNNKLRMNLSSFIFWIVFITLNAIMVMMPKIVGNFLKKYFYLIDINPKRR